MTCVRCPAAWLPTALAVAVHCLRPPAPRTCRWIGSSCRRDSRSASTPQVPSARSLALGRQGHGVRRHRGDGSVYAIVPARRRQAGSVTIADGLNAPMASRSATARCTSPKSAGSCATTTSRRSCAIRPSRWWSPIAIPKESHHGWKYIAFGPDGWLYVPVGAPCNVCEPDPDRYALISRIKPDGSGYEVFARGIRNTVGFDWDPRTKRALVQRPRPRHDGRRHALRRVEPCA